jgi:transposase
MLVELSVVEQRYHAVMEVLSAGVPVVEVAERYGVSRKTVHAWIRRYRDEGLSGLTDRSHRPHHHPWQIAAEVEAVICEMRRNHPRWGVLAGSVTSWAGAGCHRCRHGRRSTAPWCATN